MDSLRNNVIRRWAKKKEGRGGERTEEGDEAGGRWWIGRMCGFPHVSAGRRGLLAAKPRPFEEESETPRFETEVTTTRGRDTFLKKGSVAI